MPRPNVFPLTPPLITSIYTIDTVAGGLQTIRGVDARGLIRGIAGYIDSTITPALDLYFFESAPTAIADNAAFTQAYADQVKRLQDGKVSVVSGDYITENSKTRFEKKAVNLDYVATGLADYGYALYLFIVNRGTPTFPSASALRLDVTMWGQ